MEELVYFHTNKQSKVPDSLALDYNKDVIDQNFFVITTQASLESSHNRYLM
jgi:hypothetical protein